MSTSVSSPATGAGEVAGGGVKSSYRLSLKRQSPSHDGTELGSRETWISTNKILNSSYCGRRTNSRNPNFDYDESKLLISLWGDPQVQKALITTHKKHPVIAELARKMREHGYNRSTEEINTRIKNLKCFYNRIKKDMAAGLINQTTWRHYADMDEIISRPVFGNRKKSDHDSLDEDGRSTQSLELEPPPLPSSDEPLPVKLELMSDDDDGDDERDDDEPTEIRAEDLLTIDASFPEETSAAASSSSSSSAAGSSGGIAKKSYPSSASRSNGRATNSDAVADRNSELTAASAAAKDVRKGRAGGNGGNADCTQDDDDDDDDDEDDDEEDDEDDDDDGSDFDVENEFNDGLDEILLKAQSKGNSSAAGSKTITGNSGTTSSDSANTSKAPGASGLVIESVTSGNGTTPSTSMAAATAPQQQQQGKISVVPTNLLLKSPSSLPSSSSSLSTPIQIFTKPTVSLAAATGGSTVKPVTMGIGAGTPTAGVPGAPMKLLLVNTVGKDGTTKQILTPAGDMTALPKLLPTTTLKQATATVPLSLASTSGGSPIVSIPTVNVPPNKVPTIAGVHSLPKHMPIGRPPVPPGSERESATPFKALLTQLVTIQRENLALNQERLALEKERLEFETKFGGSFVSMIQNMSTFFSNMLKHQRQDMLQSRQPVAAKEGVPSQATETKSVESKKSDSSASSPAASKATTDPRTEEVSTHDPKQPAAPAAKTPTITSSSVAVDSAPATAAIGKHPLPAPPALTPLVVNASDETVGTPVSKKRRMITRNATQPATSTTDDALKTEVISDTDDH
ncbi:acrosomal protein KIAA1210-like [Anopheles albimanus]|uniref:acrosomal protein KIAA1210-like n=1 Tax=Anopheles albimanus TaxID=7167 RepID=UPI001641FE34|nr:acrosomal protein KIAA1210-like [Anopheles albimanus]